MATCTHPRSSQRHAVLGLLVTLSVFMASGLWGCAPSSDPDPATISLRDVQGGADDSTREEATTYDPAVRDGADVPYVTTPTVLIDSMLALAAVTANDVVYDLGSGDGRIPIRAATARGAQGVGIEIRADLVERARRNAQAAGVADRVTFREGDLFEADISEATVVTLYLLPSVNRALRPKLWRELEPGTRIVSRSFDMGAWTPDDTVVVAGTPLYRWTIPDTPPAERADPSAEAAN